MPQSNYMDVENNITEKTTTDKVKDMGPIHDTFRSMGIFPLILGRVRLMGLNSHLRTNNYVPSHVDENLHDNGFRNVDANRCESKRTSDTVRNRPDLSLRGRVENQAQMWSSV